MNDKPIIIHKETWPFKILTLADIQETKSLDTGSLKKIDRLIETTKPDLIVLLGDVIMGPLVYTYNRAEQIICSVCDAIEKHKIPFTVVFGNHDTDCLVNLEKQMQIYKRYPLCITPVSESRETAQGYIINVDIGKEEIIQLMMVDSGRTSIGRYGIQYKEPKPETIDWISRVVKADVSPIYLFQHVAVYNIFRLLQADDTVTDGAIKGHGAFRKKWFTLNKGLGVNGQLGEFPCPPWEASDKEFKALTANGSVKVAVFGHDHKNAFTGKLDGIQIIQTPAAGLHCYGFDNLRGGNLLTITSNNVFSTDLVLYQ